MSPCIIGVARWTSTRDVESLTTEASPHQTFQTCLWQVLVWRNYRVRPRLKDVRHSRQPQLEMRM